MQPFFFASQNERLFGVFRGENSASRAWVLVPPFAEEEKTTRRIFTDLARFLGTRGHASLIFSLRGTGDSSGDFSRATLADWRADLRAASGCLLDLVPHAKLGVLGVRLGASLAILERDNADSLCLIEPVLNGKSYLNEQIIRKKLRAKMGGEGSDLPRNDLDGWLLGEALRADLEALDLSEVAPFSGRCWVLGIGPKPEVPPALAGLAVSMGAQAHAVRMPAFWNQLDPIKPTPLLQKLEALDV